MIKPGTGDTSAIVETLKEAAENYERMARAARRLNSVMDALDLQRWADAIRCAAQLLAGEKEAATWRP